ncbi:metallophosphoesterase [Martelella alba]|uniref:Phosphohydrolase n=1 Tax=Martelella alba TaxID=2590451 RepID=A0ABY2SGA8_9HYPH|nr:metallophosphoesterase [Martelella alba]TKI02518.1 phosphohydrolase [Martelella alba]
MRIIQISDLHLFSNEQGSMHGYNTYHCLQAVINDIISNIEIKADAVFVTGDISEDKTVNSYLLALKELEKLKLPIHYIPGNHDDKKILNECFATSSLVVNKKLVKTKDWIILKMDTAVFGSDSGIFTPEDNLTLQHVISKNTRSKIALFMHHHPVAVGVPLVDNCMVSNNSLLLNKIENYQQIKGIYCGHAHVIYQTYINDCSIEICPATCFQWKSGADTIQTKDLRGYKVVEFSENYSSTVCRLT